MISLLSLLFLLGSLLFGLILLAIGAILLLKVKKTKEFPIVKKLLVLLTLLILLGGAAACGIISAVQPWSVVLNKWTPATVEPSGLGQPVSAAPTSTAASPLPLSPVPTLEAANPGSCSAPLTLTPGAGGRITYKGISFVLDPALVGSVDVQECPAVPFNEQLEPGAAHPAYIGFRFPTGRQRIDYQPELRVYTIAGDMRSYLYPLNVLEDLRQVVGQQPEPVTWFEAAPLHVHRSYLPFADGKGVRGVVEYAQDIFFFTNNGLLYEYDGLVDDGRYYVNLRYPVAVPFLMDIEHSDPSTNVNPQAIPVPEWDGDYNQMGKIIGAYNQEAVRRFDQMADGDFAPSLQLLDALVGSIEISVP